MATNDKDWMREYQKKRRERLSTPYDMFRSVEPYYLKLIKERPELYRRYLAQKNFYKQTRSGL